MNYFINKYESRCEITRQKGLVIWFTGLSGSGKSTLAYKLEKKLLQMHKLAYVLDGDIIRTGLNSDLGFSNKDRSENIRRVAELSAILKDASIITIVAFISPFIHMREYARILVGKYNFIEVYIKASLETCILRDPKGLYNKVLNNEIPDFTGITSPNDEPINPALLIDTDKLSIKESSNLLIDYVLKYLDNQNP
jgi:adenylylsulfate kinase